MAIENSNVRVIGTMKNFQGESVLNCYSIRPVSDPNEVSCHMLEVAYAKLYYQKVLFYFQSLV